MKAWLQVDNEEVEGSFCASMEVLSQPWLTATPMPLLSIGEGPMASLQMPSSTPRFVALALADLHYRPFLKIRWERLASFMTLTSCSHMSRSGDCVTLGASLSPRVCRLFGGSLPRIQTFSLIRSSIDEVLKAHRGQRQSRLDCCFLVRNGPLMTRPCPNSEQPLSRSRQKNQVTQALAVLRDALAARVSSRGKTS